MPPDVKARNLTNKRIRLVHADLFATSKPKFGIKAVAHGISNVTSTITNSIGLTNSTTRREVPEIAPDAPPSQSRDVDIEIQPFAAVQTDIKPTIDNDKDRLRLTFEVDDGGRHRMYCPVPTTQTETLEVMEDVNGVRLTGIFLPDDAHVTLYESNDLDRWMDKINDNVPLGALSVPGTHNSPTCHAAPPSVRCQAVSPRDQLQNGVRFFDIRVQVPEPFDPNSDKLVLVHSVFPIALSGNKYFRDLYNDCRQFLDEHNSETLIMSLKREGSGNGTDEQLSIILKNHYANNDQWFTEPRVPRLGEVRNKLVLVRRFNLDEPLKHEHEDRGWGIDGSSWADNCSNAMCPSGDICVQDFYQVQEAPSIDEKIKYAREQLDRSGCCKFNLDDHDAKYPLYINFLSASNFWKIGTWPEKIAARVNPAIIAYLCRDHMMDGDHVKEGDWSTGIVVCDWVGLDGDWDLVRCVVGMNARLPRR